MTKYLPAFSWASVTVLALVFPGLAAAQIWSSPKLLANGSAIAVSTNGTGAAAVMFGTLSAVVETGGAWGTPVALSNLGPYGNGSGTLAVAPNGDVLAVWSYRTSNKLWRSQHRIRWSEPSHAGMGRNHQPEPDDMRVEGNHRHRGQRVRASADDFEFRYLLWLEPDGREPVRGG